MYVCDPWLLSRKGTNKAADGRGKYEVLIAARSARSKRRTVTVTLKILYMKLSVFGVCGTVGEFGGLSELSWLLGAL